MKIKEGFELRKFGGKWLTVTVDEAADDNNVLVTLNETGAFVWKILRNESEYSYIVSKVVENYEVNEATAKKDLDNFLRICRENGIVDE
jgi:RIO-like serine/threonine protein kinase